LRHSLSGITGSRSRAHAGPNPKNQEPKEPAMNNAPTPVPGDTAANAARHPGDEAAPGTPQTAEDICPECDGSGKLAAGKPCPHCGGSGRVVVNVGDA